MYAYRNVRALRRRVPRVGALLTAAAATAAATAAVGVGGTATAEAAYDVFTPQQWYWGDTVPYGYRRAITQVRVDTTLNITWGHSSDIVCEWAQNSPSDSTVAPTALTVAYSENYIHNYGTTPPAYTGDYAGTPYCIANGIKDHPYSGSIRRGINFKTGLSHVSTSSGGIQWY
jgi:hypothetical protein